MAAYIYAILDPRTGKPRYVGHSKNVPLRVRMHWKHRRNKVRNRENPQFYGWLQSFLLCPDYKILATVPYDRRYQAEREWTLSLRVTCDLFNISDGAAPIKRGPLSAEHRAKLAEKARLQARRKAVRSAGPTGGLGHTPETRAKMAASRRAYWAGKTPEERSAAASNAARAQQVLRRRGGAESPSAAAA